jgi:hypothetical protein
MKNELTAERYESARQVSNRDELLWTSERKSSSSPVMPARLAEWRWLDCTQKVRRPNEHLVVHNNLYILFDKDSPPWTREIILSLNEKKEKCARHKVANRPIQLKNADTPSSQGREWESTSSCNSNSVAAVNPARKNVTNGTLWHLM